MVSFHKYHGLGNDFILIDNRSGVFTAPSEKAAAMCHRRFGIGADGIILAENSKTADIKMVIYNSDSSRAEMCGNGLRCFSKFVYDRLGIRKTELSVETDAGLMISEIQVENGIAQRIRVNMGIPYFHFQEIPCTIEKELIMNETIHIEDKTFNISCLLMGVPHTVVFTDCIEDSYVVEIGQIIENSRFFPKKTNVNFVKRIREDEIELRTWERGAGYTYACGTGTCASVVAGVLNGLLKEKTLAHLRGGDLLIDWQDRKYVFMEGPAIEVYSGSYSHI